jgi:hypothetical protein
MTFKLLNENNTIVLNVKNTLSVLYASVFGGPISHYYSISPATATFFETHVSMPL